MLSCSLTKIKKRKQEKIVFNHHQNTKSNYNILCVIWPSTIDHPRNNKNEKKREKDKSIVKRQENTKPTLIFFALSQSTNNVLATLIVFFITQPALST